MLFTAVQTNTTSSSTSFEQTALQQQKQINATNNRTNRNNLGSISNFFQFIRNSSRNLC